MATPETILAWTLESQGAELIGNRIYHKVSKECIGTDVLEVKYVNGVLDYKFRCIKPIEWVMVDFKTE